MPTANVVVSRSGTNFTIDVTPCNLDSNLLLKDFIILHNGNFVPNTDYTKTTRTILTYTGTPLGTTTIEVRRKTPTSRVQPVMYGTKLSSTLYNAELDRKTRWQEEVDLNGVGGSPITAPIPKDDPFGIVWDGDTAYPPTRNSVYNYVKNLAPTASPNFTETPTAPTPTLGDNTTKLATTAFIQSTLSNSPALGGSPTTTTQPNGTNNNSIATTAFVQNAFSNSPVLGGSPTATTPANGSNNTSIATTAFAQSLYKPSFKVVKLNSQNNVNGNVVIVWDAKDYDTNSAFSSNTFTVPTGFGGLYLFLGSVLVSSTTNLETYLGALIRINNSITVRLDQTHNDVTSRDFILSGSVILNLSAGDTLQMLTTNFGSGVSYSIKPDENSTHFSGFRIGVL